MTEKIIVSISLIVFGIILILVGRSSIKNKIAYESGFERPIVNKIMGRSNTQKGDQAVSMGRQRIIMGALLIIFGIIFFFVGPFLMR